MLQKMKKLLILTLYSGENDYPMLLASLRQQTFVDWAHVTIEGLPNKDAHERLYRTIMEQAALYNWFLKLDADMVFRGRESLAEMIQVAEARSACDQIIWPVLDFLSGGNLLGIHLFSNRVRWRFPLPDLLVDADPIIPGERLQLPNRECAHVLHCAFPSLEQALRFGIHRGIKCFAKDISVSRRKAQLSFLLNVWSRHRLQPDRWRGAVMVGAEYARRNRLMATDYKKMQLPQMDALLNMACRAEQTMNYCGAYWSRAAQIREVLLSARIWSAVVKERVGKWLSGNIVTR